MPLFKKSSAEGEKSVLQIRALIAVLFTCALIYGFLFLKVSEETFMPIATTAIFWYFSKRDIEDTAAIAAKPSIPPPPPQELLVEKNKSI